MIHFFEREHGDPRVVPPILCRYVLGMAKAGTAPTQQPAAGSFPPLSGAAFLCSVPQTGNKQMVMRFLRKDPLLSLKLTWWVLTGQGVRHLHPSRPAAAVLAYSGGVGASSRAAGNLFVFTHERL